MLTSRRNCSEASRFCFSKSEVRCVGTQTFPCNGSLITPIPTLHSLDYAYSSSPFVTLSGNAPLFDPFFVVGSTIGTAGFVYYKQSNRIDLPWLQREPQQSEVSFLYEIDPALSRCTVAFFTTHVEH